MKLLTQTELINLKALAEKGDKEAIAKLFYYAAGITKLLQDAQYSVEKLYNQLNPWVSKSSRPKRPTAPN